MFDLKGEWDISFAGCGFMGIYYVGASSCFIEQVPHLVQGASKIYGASAGALMAAVLSIGMPIDHCCVNIMSMAKEARRRKLGPLHPSFNLLKLVRDSLVRDLPDDAHVRASGKLCVSLTRVSDGKNVLASQFDSNEELIQALLCSCFIPFYCGVIPPTYRGVRYVDGAISNNLPQFNVRSTVTVSPFSGESDVCPRESTLNFHEVRFNNVSIQVNAGNMYRVTSAFFPPEPEIMAEICHNGYMDARRFLQENNLFRTECPSAGLLVPSAGPLDQVDSPKPPCCEREDEAPADEGAAKSFLRKRLGRPHKHHWWLEERSIENLPVLIKNVLCQACKDRGSLLTQVRGLLPVRLASYMLMPYTLPVESAYFLTQRYEAYFLTQRLVDWIPDALGDMRWLYGVAGDIYRQAWRGGAEDTDSEGVLRRCSSLPSGLESLALTGGEHQVRPLTLPDTPSENLYWDIHSDPSHLTPPPTPTPPPTSTPHSDPSHLPLTPPPTPTSPPTLTPHSDSSHLTPPTTPTPPPTSTPHSDPSHLPLTPPPTPTSPPSLTTHSDSSHLTPPPTPTPPPTSTPHSDPSHLPLTPPPTPTSPPTLTPHSDSSHLTPPPTPTSPSKSSLDEGAPFPPSSRAAGGRWGAGLSRAVRWVSGSVSPEPLESLDLQEPTRQCGPPL